MFPIHSLRWYLVPRYGAKNPGPLVYPASTRKYLPTMFKIKIISLNLTKEKEKNYFQEILLVGISSLFWWCNSYRNKKGDVSTNVLAACDPDLRFIYVLPEW